jgi:hypothetical protein
MRASSILADAPASDDFSRRQILPASAAVKGPRFSTTKHWAISSVAREVLDSFDLPLTPRPERNIDPAESIVLEGCVILNSLRTGSHVVKQRRTVDFETWPELSIAEPFAVVADDSIRGAAAERLRQISTVKRPRVAPRPVARPAPAAGRSQVLFAAVLVLGALAFAAWIAVRS